MFRRKVAAVGLALIAALVGGAGVAGADTHRLFESDGSMVRSLSSADFAADTSVEAARWVVIGSPYGNGRQCMDADTNGGGNGTKVQTWDCYRTPQQLWLLRADGSLENGRFRGMCMDADTNGGGRDGTKVQLWQCNGKPQQRWFMRANDLALYNVAFNNNLNTVVDRDINGPDNGGRIQLWTKNFKAQQWWCLCNA